MKTIKKRCTKCGIEKPLVEFHKHQSGKYGKSSHCKICTSINLKLKRKECPSKFREYKRREYLKHRERIDKRVKEWVKQHPEERKKIVMRWVKNNPEKVKMAAKLRVKNLSQTYLKNILTRGTSSLTHKDIPSILVQLKKAQLTHYRALHNNQ